MRLQCRGRFVVAWEPAGRGARCGGMLLVFGTINLDVIYPLAHLPGAGETVWSVGARIEPGGKAANQAAAAARDGAEVKLAGAVGEDGLAEAALAGLARDGVDLGWVARVPETTGHAAVCVDAKGYTMVVAEPGANLHASAAQIPDAALRPGTTLLLQMEPDPEHTAALLRRARAGGARSVLLFSPPQPIDAGALSCADFLLGNSEEIAWLGEHLGTGNNPASMRAALGTIAVRMMGVQGAEAASDGGYLRMPALRVHMRDSTGAGDCFTGVFAAAIDRGMDLRRALRRAAVAAALSTTRLGAQPAMPAAADIDAAMAEAPAPTDRQPEIAD